MLDALASVDWKLQVQPSWNGPNEIVEALRDLASATSVASGYDAYSRVLYAVGNNHAGTYYPVVLRVVPFLEQILEDREAPSVARCRTLDVLIDLLGSFAPETGFEVVSTDGGPRPLQDCVRAEILALAERVALPRPGATEKEVQLARDLHELLAE